MNSVMFSACLNSSSDRWNLSEIQSAIHLAWWSGPGTRRGQKPLTSPPRWKMTNLKNST